MNMEKYEGPLNTCTSHKIEAILHRLYTLLHFINISSIIYYRISTLNNNNVPLLPWLLLFSSELSLSFYSLLSLAFGWRHITWTAFPDRLPKDETLPHIDVFILTSDPAREPPWDVANTVVSAMSLDYPTDKISVYLSDDGGSSLTLLAIKEGVEFAKWWVPFCSKYKIKTTCPKAYFGNNHDYDYAGVSDVAEYLGARREVAGKYMEFQERLQISQEKAQFDLNGLTASRDHSPVIQVIENYSKDDQSAEVNLPSLIYVAREKRPNHPHHFKAGAINALLRVSGVISNSPYILVLDSDMYSNDPSSARQSMCFHLDPSISSSLAFVQFPQKFHNINLSNDIYDGQIRSVFQVKWPRMGGLEGPILSGTCFYIKRKALYGDIIVHQREYDLPQLKQYYGLSNEFIKSIQQSSCSHRIKQGELTSTQLSEAKFLASSTFEQNTKWGEMVGFMYASVVEDYMTGFSMQCRGWKSVFYNPERPAFLGTATISLNDAFIQTTRWQTGFVDVAFSRFFPLFYGPFVNNLSLLQSMCYAYFAIQPLCCFHFWCLAIIPQSCLLLGFPLYPKATSPWFMVFAFAFLSRLSKNLADVLITKSTTKTWWNEERFWMMRGVTSSLYGSIDSTLKKVGLRESSFTTTNKVDDKERIELYNKGIFDFRTSTKFIIPLVGLVIFNLASFVGGVLRMFILDQWNEFLGQISLSFFVILLGYPVIKGMVVRTDDASISASVSLKSALFAMGLFVIGSICLRVV
ncbi:cellulose synthase-like protein G2 [Silene latifolia]|uniref:cellulose synthase-like protein G2 n=1 Tax=Silene latifolia TaxID=37657 RepID=UPI003D77F335